MERTKQIGLELDAIHAMALAVEKSLQNDDFDTAIETMRRRDDRMNHLQQHVMAEDPATLKSLLKDTRLGEMVKKIQELDEKNLATLHSRMQDAYEGIRKLERERRTIRVTRSIVSARKKRIVDFIY